MHEGPPPTDETTARGRRRPRARSVAIVLALAIGALIVAGYLLRGQAPRMVPILTELGVWAAIRTGRRWSLREPRERLGGGVRRVAAAVSRSTGLAW